MIARPSTARSGRLCGRTFLLPLIAGAAIALLAGGCTPIQPSPSNAPAAEPPASSVAATGAAEPSAAAAVTATTVVTAPAALTATVVATASADLPPEPAASADSLPTEAEAPAETPAEAAASVDAGAPATATASADLFVPLTTTAANAPVALAFPEIDVTVPVAPMGWEVVRTDGVRSTRWVLPEDAAGWHPDSAQAGAPGNIIISGSQLAGAAVFAPIALGEVTVGQEILLTDATGASTTYTVVEVSEPLALEGDPAATAALLGYLQPNLAAGASRLTLLTGWPDFTTTHRVVVVAETTLP